MNIMKFIRKQGKTKESNPKIFEESIECEVDKNEPAVPIIPLSSIRSELIKCGFKAEEPDKFMMIDNGKVKKVSIDCFDTVTFAIEGAYELKAVNFANKDNIVIEETKDLIEYLPVEIKPIKPEDHDGNLFTLFFGDFLKMIILHQYYNMNVLKSFYDRLGDIPVFVSNEDFENEVLDRLPKMDLIWDYVEVTTEKGETYIINLLL